MFGVTSLLTIFSTLTSKVNQGFEALSEKDSVYKPVYCDIKWRIYDTCNKTGNFTEYCVEDGLDMFNTSSYYNKSNKNTLLLSNPFYSNYSRPNVKPMIEALTSRCDFNLIALDNTLHTNVDILDYPLSMLQVYKDSLRFAMVLNRAIKLGLFSPQYVTALGYSLGAQIAGHVCRHLDEKCGHILGIDPAGPLFTPKDIPLVRSYPQFRLVSRSDACQVVFVQCNRWMLGSGFKEAHINIIVNNGLLQPSCFPANLLCSHDFCHTLVIDAILNHGRCVATSEDTASTMHFLRSFYSKPHRIENFTLKLPLDKWKGYCGSDKSKEFYLTTADEPSCSKKKQEGSGKKEQAGSDKKEQVGSDKKETSKDWASARSLMSSVRDTLGKIHDIFTT